MAPATFTEQKPWDCLKPRSLNAWPPQACRGGQVAPAFGFAAELIAMPAWAKYHAVDDTSTPQNVDTASIPPPNNRRLPLPMFEGVTLSGISDIRSVHAEAMSSAPMENSIKLWIKPVIVPEHSASRLAFLWGTKVSAQLAAARDRLAAIAATEATICSMLMAQILSAPTVSSPKPTGVLHVLAASLMPVARAASWVVACKASKVQEATVASSAGVRFLNP
mmetsp:Transcript_38980/g.110556  ORF Transcript_38980/g.110556 Transcript_38980/m.110556 type:complete len:221 (-) Transcript_38980:60-722(-)